MAKKKIIILPKTQRILTEMGENIRLARLRRRLSAEQVAERANTAGLLSAIGRAPTVRLASAF